MIPKLGRLARRRYLFGRLARRPKYGETVGVRTSSKNPESGSSPRDVSELTPNHLFSKDLQTSEKM